MNGKAQVIVTDTFYKLYLWRGHVKRKKKKMGLSGQKGEI